MTFEDFRETCRCSLSSALSIVREQSKKNHVFVGVDEFTRVEERTSTQAVYEASLRNFMATFTGALDSVKGVNRTNFVFTSLASFPLMEIETKV
jgi:hypothetical protein